MRIIRTVAAFVALGTVAFALGDLASHPNPLGAVGILGLIAAFAFLLSFLFRTEGRRSKRAKKAPEPPRVDPEPTRKRAPAAGVWADGWDAGEAQSARQRRKRN